MSGMFGRRRCAHQWRVVGVKYNPQRGSLTSASGNDPDMLAEAMYGVTVLTQRCTECGWVSITRHAGEADVTSDA